MEDILRRRRTKQPAGYQEMADELRKSKLPSHIVGESTGLYIPDVMSSSTHSAIHTLPAQSEYTYQGSDSDFMTPLIGNRNRQEYISLPDHRQTRSQVLLQEPRNLVHHYGSTPTTEGPFPQTGKGIRWEKL